MKAIILAAGKGTRMKSKINKVMHLVGGLPMIRHVLNAVKGAGVNDCFLVIGHGGDEIKEYLGDEVTYILQMQQLGTGHAVMQAEPHCNLKGESVLVLAGDTPLITEEIIKDLIETHKNNAAAATVLVTKVADPTGYGRIIRAENGRFRIVEEKDASPAEKLVQEINTGCYCFDASELFVALKQVRADNEQGEYYLTDVLEIMQSSGQAVVTSFTADFEAVQGINNRLQLAEAEKILQRRIQRRLMESGVTIIAPETTFIGSEVRIGQDTIIYPFTIIEGKTVIGQDCKIGPGARIKDSIIGDMVEIDSSVVISSTIGDRVTIGPFAYLRPETKLARGVKVGDFVEIKKSIIGENSKVPHLSYVGDSNIGKNVNIGAGTITCNYDGVNKHRTVIEDNAFIGSNTNLVAPLTIGRGAKTGAGSTITKDVPEGVLAVEREKQRHIPLSKMTVKKE